MLVAGACADVECYDTLCVPFGSGSSGNIDGADRVGDTNVPDVPPPEDCVEAADAKDAPNCLVDTFALFVDAAGSDSNKGTKEKPLQHIQAALERAPTQGLRRVYVCGVGPFAEHLKPTSAVHIFGGFACGSWTYAEGTRAKIAPTDKGYLLHLDSISAQVRVSDVDFVAPDVNQTKDGTSSIAIFANASNVSFLRASISAGVAADGSNGAVVGNGTLTSVSVGNNSLDGNPAVGATRGDAKECTCSNSGANKSRGGVGGATENGGGPGGPTGGQGGLGGSGAADCPSMGVGGTGGLGASGASAASIAGYGSLTANGWSPANGSDATESGQPGFGGGGGGGRSSVSAGGGGACGGCGGLPGKGGGGGGASIALLSFASTVSIRESTLIAKGAGAGGGGGAGGPGQGGGNGASGGSVGCQGGSGGMGGLGGHGSGGAGGVSFGILYSGIAPESTATVVPGSFGAAGPAGGTASNAGPAGKSGDIKDVTQL